MPEPVVQHHTRPGNVGVLLVHGTADPVVAYGGKPTGYLSAEDGYRYWSKRLGMKAMAATLVSPTRTAPPSRGRKLATVSKVWRWSRCATAAIRGQAPIRSMSVTRWDGQRATLMR